MSAAARLARGLARPGARALVTAAVVITLTVVALWWSQQGRPAPLRPSDVARVGVAAGGSIPGYLDSSRRDLAGYSGAPTHALVSFATYVEPAAVGGLLAGVAAVEIIVRVPLPDGQTEIVRLPVVRLPLDLDAGLDRVAARKEAEVVGYRRLAGGEVDHELRDSYAEGARLAGTEAAAMRRRSGCVYAAVVVGAPAALLALAGRPGVRVVDPAPEVTRPAEAVFLPPLPEQEDVARPPSGR